MDFKELFEGKTVLITGGTGFLGRALTKRILEFDPQSIRIYSRDEVKHYKHQRDFDNHPKLRHLIGDVRDYDRLNKAMRGVDIVIHAAALKRIDLIEYNVEESIKTNVAATLNIVQAALANDVETAVYVSTDKACNPVNTYGACKFVSERIFIESNYSKGRKPTKFVCVRYGNVLESTGSVIPIFRNLIEQDRPVTLTDERMTRFIITHDEACDLIFKTIQYGVGGEVFVPRLPAFKLVDLVDIMIKRYDGKKDIEIIGLRPGEKIHEMMINQTEVPRTYEFKDVYVITSEIEKYQKGKQSPIYMKEGRKLSEKDFLTYASDQAVIPRDEVESLLEDNDLL